MQPSFGEKLLTIEDCAAHTGESVSTWRVRVQRREIPHIRFGTVKGVRVKQSDLEAFIASRSVKTKVVNIG